MLTLVFDTETTGFPSRKVLPNDPSQPHAVSIAALLVEDDGKERGQFYGLINPGVPIPSETTKIHGLTDEIVRRVGMTPDMALMTFLHLLGRAEMMAAHNAPFDVAILEILAARCRVKLPKLPPVFCTCRKATPILNLPPTEKMKAAGRNNPKPPSLAECFKHFFDEEIHGAHDAMIDARACARIMFHIRGQAQQPAAGAAA